MFFANSSNLIVGAIMAVILIFALVSVVRTMKGGGCSCGCVSGRACDGDCARCGCEDCADAKRVKKRQRGA